MIKWDQVQNVRPSGVLEIMKWDQVKSTKNKLNPSDNYWDQCNIYRSIKNMWWKMKWDIVRSIKIKYDRVTLYLIFEEIIFMILSWSAIKWKSN